MVRWEVAPRTRGPLDSVVETPNGLPVQLGARAQRRVLEKPDEALEPMLARPLACVVEDQRHCTKVPAELDVTPLWRRMVYSLSLLVDPSAGLELRLSAVARLLVLGAVVRRRKTGRAWAHGWGPKSGAKGRRALLSGVVDQ